MSQFHEFLSVCSHEEAEQLASLELSGKEAFVFDILYRHRNSDAPSQKEITREAGITPTHYYKINSVLIRKCADLLSGERPEDKVLLFRRKNLFVLMKHEMLYQGKQLERRGDDARTASFYLFCFQTMIDTPFRFYDEKATKQFGKKYLECKPDHSPADEDYVKFNLLFADCNRFAAKKDPQKAFGKTAKDLEEYETKLLRSGHALALYYLYRTFCSYYTYYRKDHNKVIRYLDLATGLKDKISSFFPVPIGQFLRLLRADALLSGGQAEDAFREYEAVFGEDLKESMYGYYYHAEQYAISALISGKTDDALRIVETYFRKAMDERMDIYATRGAITLAKVYLTTGQLKEAGKMIALAGEINEKSFYLPFDVQIRLLENLYFFFKKDFDFSEQLVSKNLKFVHSQKDRELLSDYLLIWKILGAFLTSIYKNCPFPAKLEDDYARINERYRNLYANLLTIARRLTGEEAAIKNY